MGVLKNPSIFNKLKGGDNHKDLIPLITFNLYIGYD